MLSKIAGLFALGMIFSGTWPIVFGMEPVDPIIKPETFGQIRRDISDSFNR